MSVVRTRGGLYLISFGVIALVVGLIVQRRMTQAALPSVRVETIERRDLSSVVMASGTILPKRSVHISADTVGRVTRLAVEEGESVRAGQFLLQIDPEALESVVQRGEAGLRAAREALNSAKVAIGAAQARYEMASQNRMRVEALFQEKLVSRETLEQTEEVIEIRQSELQSREAEMRAAEQRLEQEIADLRGARHHLSKVTIESPMQGLITQLSIEEGETVLVGTMNNPGTVLMTIADLSVIQAELEVNESDVVDLRLGQRANIRIDALVGKSLSRSDHQDRLERLALGQPVPGELRTKGQFRAHRDTRRRGARGSSRLFLLRRDHHRHHPGRKGRAHPGCH